ncbi:hypothetical protein Nepgr_016484 [Nepenthes gracilis]|uniref:Uncharacterized protein n=1 Tax=Nepenthes gracilis TaxID=150966 RepID=A0AAD3SMS8_NEPGR|nr:hypothetical protein Nepgr_016484 [Nepenthes gracilis]
MLATKQSKDVANQSDIGVHDGIGKALPENLGSDVKHPPVQSNGIRQEAPTEATENNQWGIMPPVDFVEEIHQLSVPDHVAGLLDLKLNDLESPPNNPFSVLQDSPLEPIGSTAQLAAVPIGGCHELTKEVLGCYLEQTGKELLQEAQSSSHEGFAGLNGCMCKKINSTVDVDITPESINWLTSKYSLADPIHVESTSVSPTGSPDGDQLGEVQEAIGKDLIPLGSDDLSLDNYPMKESSMSEEVEGDEADPMLAGFGLFAFAWFGRCGVEAGLDYLTWPAAAV